MQRQARLYCSNGQPDLGCGPSVPECNAPRQGRYFYAAQLPGALTESGIASILRAGVCYFGADQLDPWRSLETKEYNLGWKERYEEYVEYFEPENAEKAWGVINETLISQRRLRAVKLGFLRLPREWVLCAGPQLPKTRDPKLTEDGVPHLIFLSPDMILTLARKHFSPQEVASAIDLHPSMARFLDKSTCVPRESVNLKLVEEEFEQGATTPDPEAGECLPRSG